MDRIDKINKLVKREISSILQQEFQDPRLMMVTILNVEVTRDLRSARIKYSFLGDQRQLKEVAQSLHKLSGYIRKLLGASMQTRNTPRLEFIYDKSVIHSVGVEQVLEELRRKEKPAAGEEEE